MLQIASHLDSLVLSKQMDNRADISNSECAESTFVRHIENISKKIKTRSSGKN
jgi:hypothetical protein